MSSPNHILIFTRYPQPGSTKTRLIEELGDQGAANLQRRLTEMTVETAIDCTKRLDATLSIHFHGGSPELMRAWLGPHQYHLQAAGDLGEKMQAAFTHAFSTDSRFAVLVGSDIPGLSADLLEQAFSSLHHGAPPLGPTLDGGYYLLGLDAIQAPPLFPPIFENIPWSTPEVFNITFNRMRRAGHEPSILPQLRDVDHPEDLWAMQRAGLL